jgi:TP901 family phage tail tape measure protein
VAITRDLWIVLRARDEASRIVRSFGTNVAGAASMANSNMSTFEKTMANVATRLNQFAMVSMLAGTAMAGFGAAGLAFVKSATDVAAEYDRQVRRTMTQIDGITTSLDEVADVGRRVARQVGMPFEQMQDTLFFIFSSMNVSVEQAEKLLKGFAKEAVAGQASIDAAAKTTISIMNSLGLKVEDLTRIQNVQFQIVRKGIITYEELSETIGRALPAAARSGQTFETLGAMMAFLTRNGLSAAMAATSAARALESFAHPKTVAKLEDMGIAVRNAKGEFLPLVEVMSKMNDKLKVMTSPERAKFIQELFTGAGGTIQARRFWDVAFKNFGQFEEMIGFMSNASGVFDDAYATMADSVAAKSELLRNKWMLIKEALGKALLPHLLTLMTMLSGVLDWFDKLPEGTKNIIAQFILWGSVLGVVIGVLIILIGTIAFFVSSIIAGGTALAVILGIMAAVTAAVVGFTVAVALAWTKSEKFREIIGNLGEVFSRVWKEIRETAQTVAKEFNEKLRPSLEKLMGFIEEKGLPAIQRFGQIWMEEVFPKLQEAKRIFEEVAKVVIDKLTMAIDDYIQPALEKLSDWWTKNSDSIRPFLAVGAQVVKWLLIIGAVILGSAILGFAGIIVGIIVSVVVFINTLKTLWGWITTAISAVGDFFVFIWSKITEFGRALKEMFGPIWQSIYNLFQQFIGLIGDLIKMWLTSVNEIIKDWVKPFVDLIRGAWDSAFAFVRGIQQDMMGWLRDALNKIKSIWNDNLAEHHRVIVDWWVGVGRWFRDRINDIKGFFSDAKTWLVDAGKNVVTGFIDGITDKIKDLRKKLREITDMIPEVKGPKSVDLRLLLPAGMNIMKGFMKGIDSQVPMLRQQLRGLTAQIGQLPTPTVAVPTGGFQRPIPEQKTVNQTFNITTQEIDPRVHATELGFELEGRI